MLRWVEQTGKAAAKPSVVGAGPVPQPLHSDDEDGYATLKRLREWESAHPSTDKVRRPAIALSAFTQREDRIRALAAGFQMHLTKPVAPAELITVVASVARGMRV